MKKAVCLKRTEKCKFTLQASACAITSFWFRQKTMQTGRWRGGALDRTAPRLLHSLAHSDSDCLRLLFRRLSGLGFLLWVFSFLGFWVFGFWVFFFRCFGFVLGVGIRFFALAFGDLCSVPLLNC